MGTRGPAPNPASMRYIGRQKPPRTLADVPANELGRATMPRWLSKEARAFWRRHAPDLEARGYLTALDQTLFSVLCEEWANLQALNRQLAEDGYVITGARGGLRQHPLASIRQKAERGVVELMRDFGMSPLSRQRIRVTPPRPAEVDPLEAWLEPRKRASDTAS